MKLHKIKSFYRASVAPKLLAGAAVVGVTMTKASAALSTAEQDLIDTAQAKGLEIIAAGALFLAALVAASLGVRFLIKMVKRGTTAI